MQLEAAAQKIAEDPWSANKIALRESARIAQESIQPFECDSLHPPWRTPFCPCEEVERGTYAEHQSASSPPGLQSLRDYLLLRGADCQKAEPEGTSCLDEA